MKKVTRCALVLSIFPLLLSSCSSSEKNETGSKLIISQFQTFRDSKSSVIELFNLSDKTIDLSNYKLVITRSGYTENQNIELEGSVAPNDTFVIGHSDNEEILACVDLFSENLIFNGTQCVSLMKNSKLQDVIGYPSLQYEYGRYLDMCRKAEYLIGRKKYNQYDWIRYRCDSLDRLNTIGNVISNDELLEGPRLTSADFAKDFALSESVGNGGAVIVSDPSFGDGDTTTFNFGNTNPYITGRYSVRYIGIDTPETQHGNYISAQPWGYAAKDYNNEILRQAKAYAVQTVPNYALKETYNRMLGYVWVSFVSNPLPEDFVSLNFLMVKEGYSTLRFINGKQQDDDTNYKGISYMNYMRDAEILAIDNKLRVHGQEDPNFDN